MAQQNKMFAGDYDSQSDGWPPPEEKPSAVSAGSPRKLTLLDEMAKALDGCPISSPAVDALLKRYYRGER